MELAILNIAYWSNSAQFSKKTFIHLKKKLTLVNDFSDFLWTKRKKMQKKNMKSGSKSYINVK